MTTEQMKAELMYHTSLFPFRTLRKKDIITDADYSAIDTILRGKYSPIFVGESYQIEVDNHST